MLVKVKVIKKTNRPRNSASHMKTDDVLELLKLWRTGKYDWSFLSSTFGFTKGSIARLVKTIVSESEWNKRSRILDKSKIIKKSFRSFTMPIKKLCKTKLYK